MVQLNPLTAIAPPRGAGPDRRRSTRQPHVTLARVAPVADAPLPAPEAIVLNVSLHGVGLRAHQPFEPGHLYDIEIGAGPLHLVARMRIVSSRPRDDGTFDVGAEFAEG